MEYQGIFYTSKLSDKYQIIAVRFGELALKSNRVRRRLLKRLIENIKIGMINGGLKYLKLCHDWGRIYIKNFQPEDIGRIIKNLFRIPGVLSVSPAVAIPFVKENTGDFINRLINKTVEIAEIVLENNQTFGIKARRTVEFGLKSGELASEIGTAVLKKLGKSKNVKVNLNDPDWRFYIEIRPKIGLIYTDIIQSPWGGNPVDPSCGCAALITGDPSDLVSAFRVLKRGFNILPLIYISSTFRSEEDDQIGRSVYSADLVSSAAVLGMYLPLDVYYGIVIDLRNILQDIYRNFLRQIPDLRPLMFPFSDLIEGKYQLNGKISVNLIEYIISIFFGMRFVCNSGFFIKKLWEKCTNLNPDEFSDSKNECKYHNLKVRPVDKSNHKIKLYGLTIGNKILSFLSLSRKIFGILSSSNIPLFPAAFSFGKKRIEDEYINIIKWSSYNFDGNFKPKNEFESINGGFLKKIHSDDFIKIVWIIKEKILRGDFDEIFLDASAIRPLIKPKSGMISGF